MDCICLHSSRPMDSISGVLDISSRNNCRYIVRCAKCNTCRVRDVQETAVWALQSLSACSSGTEALPLGLEVKEKQGRVMRGEDKRHNYISLNNLSNTRPSSFTVRRISFEK